MLHHPAVVGAKLQLAILASLDLKAFLVNGAVVAATQKDEVGQRVRAALGPVLDVMSLAEGQIAAREAAPVVSIGERAP